MLLSFVSFTDEFRYLGSIIHNSLTSETDVNARIVSATAAFGALKKCFFSNNDIKLKDKGTVFIASCVSIPLWKWMLVSNRKTIQQIASLLQQVR